MDLISVIVPVYNAEPYLDRCIQSITDQTYSNLEIILVDDGSPDNSPAICDEWAEKDCRIKVIHKKNGGGGDARNAALNIASGDFIGMVDSDDYISPHMYQHLLSLMTPDVDIAECEFLMTEENQAPLSDGSDGSTCVCVVEDAMRLHIQDKMFRQTPPNKLYRRSVVADVRFPVGTRIDDEFWTYRVIGNAQKLVHTSCMLYAYRQQQNSVMHLKFALPRLQAVNAKCQRLEYLSKKFPTLVSEARINLWYTCLYMGQMSLLHMDKNDLPHAFELLSSALHLHSLQMEDLKLLPVKKRLWLNLSKRFFLGTCNLRNRLKIGI